MKTPLVIRPLLSSSFTLRGKAVLLLELPGLHDGLLLLLLLWRLHGR